MTEPIETEIRKALDARAHEVDVPEGLAERTLSKARDHAGTSLRERIRGLRDGRRMRGRVTGYPRFLYAGGAVATAVLLFVVGAIVTRTPQDERTLTAPIADRDVSPETYLGQPGNAKTLEAPAPVIDGPVEVQSGDATAGQVAGTIEDKSASGGGGSAGSIAGDASRDSASTQIAPVPPVPGPATGKLPPKIVRTANVEVEVKSFESAWSRANSIAARYAGFVTNSSTELIKDKLGRGTLVMRVPAAKLDAALADLRRLGTLSQMQTSGDDISAPIADVKARIRTLEAQELQLLELMRRANSLSETLEVRSQLDNIRQEIESYKAQRDVYENQVTYSTINATIFEKGIDPNDEDGGDGILRDALETAVRIGLTVVAGTLVVLGGMIPLALLALAVWFIVRAVRRRNAAA